MRSLLMLADRSPAVSGSWRLQLESIATLEPAVQQAILATLVIACLALAGLRYWFAGRQISFALRSVLVAVHALILLLVGITVLSPVVKFQEPAQDAPVVTIVADRQADLEGARQLIHQLQERGIQTRQITGISPEATENTADRGWLSQSQQPIVLVGNAGLNSTRPWLSSASSRGNQLAAPIYFLDTEDASGLRPALRFHAPQLVQAGTAEYGTVEFHRITPTSSTDSSAKPRIRVQARYVNESASVGRSKPETLWESELSTSDGEVTFSIELQREGLVELIATLESATSSGTEQPESDPPGATARYPIVVTGGKSRVLYVTDGPTWQCRFLQEALRRDGAFGIDQVRIFSASVDPQVAQNNNLYLTRLPQSASELWPFDVVVLDDPAPDSLSKEFVELLRSYVVDFGGGLILTAGATHQGAAFASLFPDLLPIVASADAEESRSSIEPGIRFREGASRWCAVPLPGTGDQGLPQALVGANWFQRARRIEPRTIVIAEHPEAVCEKQAAPLPLLAARRTGEGLTAWLATNETWRLRGEGLGQAFDRFWKTLLRRVRSSQGIGKEKYFSLACDRPVSGVGDTVTVTARLRNRDFSELPHQTSPLTAAVEIATAEGTLQSTIIGLQPMVGDVWQASWVSTQPGLYSLRLAHPETGDTRRCAFICQPRLDREPAEERALQLAIARQTGGAVLEEGTNLNEAATQIAQAARTAHQEVARQVEKPLYQFPAWFGLVAGLICTEWLARRLLGLT